MSISQLLLSLCRPFSVAHLHAAARVSDGLLRAEHRVERRAGSARPTRHVAAKPLRQRSRGAKQRRCAPARHSVRVAARFTPHPKMCSCEPRFRLKDGAFHKKNHGFCARIACVLTSLLCSFCRVLKSLTGLIGSDTSVSNDKRGFHGMRFVFIVRIHSLPVSKHRLFVTENLPAAHTKDHGRDQELLRGG